MDNNNNTYNRINGHHSNRRYNIRANTSIFSFQNERAYLILIIFLAIIVAIEVVLVERIMLGSTPTNDGNAVPIMKNKNRVLQNDVQLDQQIKEKDELPFDFLETLLKEAGIELTQSELQSLPTGKDVQSLYGSKPKILGLERCKKFQEIPQSERFIGPAGLFNSGTNLIENSLIRNCRFPDKMKKYGDMSTGMRRQVPWGKHNPVAFKNHHTAQQAGKINHNHILPIVAIKDPYTWMSSMCRHRYFCAWNNSANHCPGLVPVTPYEVGFHPHQRSLPVRLRYIPTNVTYYDSLVHLYNTWYKDWVDVDFPRLIVRYEDLLFHLEEVMKEVCLCGGGVLDEDITREVGAAKTVPVHKGSSGLKEAVMRYSNETVRKMEYWKEDLNYANFYLDKGLLDKFGYHLIT